MNLRRLAKHVSFAINTPETIAEISEQQHLKDELDAQHGVVMSSMELEKVLNDTCALLKIPREVQEKSEIIKALTDNELRKIAATGLLELQRIYLTGQFDIKKIRAMGSVEILKGDAALQQHIKEAEQLDKIKRDGSKEDYAIKLEYYRSYWDFQREMKKQAEEDATKNAK